MMAGLGVMQPPVEFANPSGGFKTIAGGHKLRHKGRQRNRAWFLIGGAAYNLVRMARLDADAA